MTNIATSGIDPREFDAACSYVSDLCASTGANVPSGRFQSIPEQKRRFVSQLLKRESDWMQGMPPVAMIPHCLYQLHRAGRSNAPLPAYSDLVSGLIHDNEMAVAAGHGVKLSTLAAGVAYFLRFIGVVASVLARDAVDEGGSPGISPTQDEDSQSPPRHPPSPTITSSVASPHAPDGDSVSREEVSLSTEDRIRQRLRTHEWLRPNLADPPTTCPDPSFQALCEAARIPSSVVGSFVLNGLTPDIIRAVLTPDEFDSVLHDFGMVGLQDHRRHLIGFIYGHQPQYASPQRSTPRQLPPFEGVLYVPELLMQCVHLSHSMYDSAQSVEESYGRHLRDDQRLGIQHRDFILRTLRYDLVAVSPFPFVNMIHETAFASCPYVDEVRLEAEDYLLAVMPTDLWVEYPPSLIAGLVLYLAVREVCGHEPHAVVLSEDASELLLKVAEVVELRQPSQ